MEGTHALPAYIIIGLVNHKFRFDWYRAFPVENGVEDSAYSSDLIYNVNDVGAKSELIVQDDADVFDVTRPKNSFAMKDDFWESGYECFIK